MHRLKRPIYTIHLEMLDSQEIPMLLDIFQHVDGVKDRAAAIENLGRAIECYQAALDYCTPQSAPFYYPMPQNNLGNTYLALAKLQDPADNLSKAIACYQDALIYRTPTSAPLDYAMTQHNLGIAYEESGDLMAALAAWHEAELYYRQIGHVQDANLMLAWIDDGEARLAGGES
jgi:tetratricopeptide (TPR) repeat protein